MSTNNNTVNATGTSQATTDLTSQTHSQPNPTTNSAQSAPIDGPPPAYEVNVSPGVHQQTTESNASSNAVVTTDFEAPPPYCLVDPSKIPNLERLPQYSQISPVEIIDLSHNAHSSSEQSTRQQHHAAISAWLASGSNMDIGTDCTFLMAFVIAFFFNWLGFLAVVCLIPTIAARFGAMSGFGLSVAKWITVMRYHEFNSGPNMGPNISGPHMRVPVNDPAQNFVFAIVLFAGFFLFVRGLISYIAVKNRAHQQGHTADVFTWY